MLKNLLKLSTCLIAPAGAASVMALTLAAAPAAAQDTFDWTGFYAGLSVGATQSRGEGEVEYTNEGLGLVSGWTTEDGAFTGEIYRAVDLGGVAAVSVNIYDPAYDDAGISLDDLNDWVTSEKFDDTQIAGTAFAGAQWQLPDANLVLGGELRASFGSFGSTFTNEWSQTIIDDENFAECETNTRDCLVVSNPLPLLALSGFDPVSGSWIDSGDEVEIIGSYTQTGSMSFGTSFDTSFSALARVGVPVDRALIYMVGGPSVANITASTSAVVNESGSITLETTDGAIGSISGSETYEWSGSVEKTRLGFTLGAGVEYAMTDNIILRGEVSYTDYGSISVTGVSSDTSATYTVEQDVGTAQAMAGVLFKF